MPLENPDSARASLVARVKDALPGADTGASVIGRYAKTAPAGPGVYRMIDEAARCSMSARRATSRNGCRATREGKGTTTASPA